MDVFFVFFDFFVGDVDGFFRLFWVQSTVRLEPVLLGFGVRGAVVDLVVGEDDGALDFSTAACRCGVVLSVGAMLVRFVREEWEWKYSAKIWDIGVSGLVKRVLGNRGNLAG